MKKMTKELKEIIEKLGWEVDELENYTILQAWSSMDENIVIEVDDDIKEAINTEYENFDIDEHALMLIDYFRASKNYVPVERIVNNAIEVEEMIYDLLIAVSAQLAKESKDADE